MVSIYFVYECDAHRSYASFALKGMFLDPARAYDEFHRIRKHWPESQDWLLCVGELEVSDAADPDAHLLMDMHELLSSDDTPEHD